VVSDLDSLDKETGERVRAAFESVTYDRPAGTYRRRRLSVLLFRAAVPGVVGVAVWLGVSLGGSGPPNAWSASPKPTTTEDEEAATVACQADGGAGYLPGERMPPLVALDWRGDGAIAVFADQRTIAICRLDAVGDKLIRGPVMSDDIESQGAASKGLGDISTLASQRPDGTWATAIVGPARGVAKVEVEIPGLEVVTASIASGWFAAWVPGQVAPGVGVVRALDEHGGLIESAVPIETPSQD